MDRNVHSVPTLGFHRRPVRGRRQCRLLRPWEFDLIHDVYSSIVSEAWFSKAAVDRSEFAAECMETYQSGVIEPDRFYDACERGRARDILGARRGTALISKIAKRELEPGPSHYRRKFAMASARMPSPKNAVPLGRLRGRLFFIREPSMSLGSDAGLFASVHQSQCAFVCSSNFKLFIVVMLGAGRGFKT